jgi:sortase A
VGIQYTHGSGHAATPPKQTWTKAQQKQGRKIAAALGNNQSTIKVPARLQGAHLPKAGSEPATRMVIPKIDLNAPVVETPPVQGVWEVADWAVGHLTTTPNPGAVGNSALSAHDDIKGEIFKRLGELKPGDPILLYTKHAVYTYDVVSATTVDPSDLSVLDPTRNATITLISCTPYWVDTQRLIVKAVLKTRAAV